MKRSFVPAFTLLLLHQFLSSAGAVVYEASTLHNAVARSETVLDLFYERWERIQNMELFFDWYGKINWVHGFQISSINRGTGQKEAVDMRLVRAYGSIIVNIPLLGGYKSKDMKKRLQYGTGTYHQQEESQENGNTAGGLFASQNLIFGFTATGFHYGLTRQGTISRGNAGTETFTDYKYAQFFDDIFAVSILYRPYFHIHLGLILNQQFEPRDDGTMSYSDPTKRTKRYFVASNLLTFLNLNATTKKDELESVAVGIIVNEIAGIVNRKFGQSFPQLTITYKKINLYNDELSDPVWVKSSFQSNGQPKSSDMPESEKAKASLYTISTGLKGFWGKNIYVDLLAEAQKPSEDLVSRLTDRPINYSAWRELRALVGWNFFAPIFETGQYFVISLGISKYWDPAIPFHRESGTDYYSYGGIFQLEGRMFIGDFPLGMEMRISHNYSTELRRMVETVDKWVVEGSLTVSF
ncbi:MAG: hypothetical protein N2316_04910 [Spirochaetes bacterium]|nr:hypothetical protein [Spirochaetota bacterium]